MERTDWAWFFPAAAIAALVLLSGCALPGSSQAHSGLWPFSRSADSGAASGGVAQVSYEEEDDRYAEAFPEYADPRNQGEQGLLDALSPSAVAASLRSAAGYGPDREKARQLYREAEQAFREAAGLEGDARRAKYDEAAGKFAAAAARWPDSVLEEDALLMVGESRFFADRYPKAAAGYDALIKKYPNTKHLEIVVQRRFAMARYWLELHEKKPIWILQPNFTDSTRPRFDTFGSATKLFDQIRLDDPAGPLADDATMAAGGALFAAGKFREADAFYDDLRKNFPGSRHQYQAHKLGVMCKLQIYQGPDYNGDMLDEAEQLIKRIYRQFPQQAADDHQHLEKAYREVRAKKAERNWHRARYFDRRFEYAGARFYYQRIVDEFPNSSFADDARERLAELAPKPDRPPDRFGWMENLFPPAEKQSRPVLSGGIWDKIILR